MPLNNFTGILEDINGTGVKTLLLNFHPIAFLVSQDKN